MSETDKEDARKVYAMVSCIDDNLGRLFKKLDSLNLSENTLNIFMTDNGPQQNRYVAGMRGKKSSVYRGGIRVPFYIKYPAGYKGNQDIETATVHMDVFPTVAEICGQKLPANRIIDGKSLVPLLQNKPVMWADRNLFFYWNRRYPELYNNISLQKGDYKLIGQTNYNAEIRDFELYDIKNDPGENNNLITDKTVIAKALKKELDQIYTELITSENLLQPPHIIIGNKNENPVFLNRNDADGERGIWAQEEVYGKWKVQISKGKYNIRFRFIQPVEPGGHIYLETGPVINVLKNTDTKGDIFEMKKVFLPEIKCDLIPFYTVKGRNIFPFWVELERIDL
jgi:arylsulfatase A-like enzyme